MATIETTIFYIRYRHKELFDILRCQKKSFIILNYAYDIDQKNNTNNNSYSNGYEQRCKESMSMLRSISMIFSKFHDKC